MGIGQLDGVGKLFVPRPADGTPTQDAKCSCFQQLYKRVGQDRGFMYKYRQINKCRILIDVFALFLEISE